MSETIFRQDYQAPSHLVSTVNLEFDLDVESTSVISTLHVVPNPEAQNQTGEFMLNGEGLTLVSVAVNGEQLDETQYDLARNTDTSQHQYRSRSHNCESL